MSMGDDDVDDDDYDDGGGCGALFRPQATSLRTHCMLLEKPPASRQSVDSAPMSCTVASSIIHEPVPKIIEQLRRGLCVGPAVLVGVVH